ncbi:hypothetical protein [Ruminococcus sp.]|uniref:hypothetical protein n=1 Tax=Ruminococcus sp. TaxID=41978 RepID=UPI0025F149A2|nr:hypothetical protein [Ruminococcus sp.]
MGALEFLNAHKIEDTVITSIICSEFEDKGIVYKSLQIRGDYCGFDKEYSYYHLFLSRIISDIPLDQLNSLKEAKINKISVVRDGNLYIADISFILNTEIISITAIAEHFSVSGLHYIGFDYTNIYGTDEYKTRLESNSYVEADKYFIGETETELPDGFDLYERKYSHHSDNASYAFLKRCQLRKNGKCVYEYTSIDDHHLRTYKDFIFHSNGHRYYPFHIDLYGISYIDVDTLEVFNYIPRGYDNDYGSPNGESFIIIDIHYAPTTDLVAYGGCYWAGPSEVMVGDLSSPLSFNPHTSHKAVRFIRSRW